MLSCLLRDNMLPLSMVRLDLTASQTETSGSPAFERPSGKWFWYEFPIFLRRLWYPRLCMNLKSVVYILEYWNRTVGVLQYCHWKCIRFFCPCMHYNTFDDLIRTTRPIAWLHPFPNSFHCFQSRMRLRRRWRVWKTTIIVRNFPLPMFCHSCPLIRTASFHPHIRMVITQLYL